MTVSEEAVEAGARASYEHANFGAPWDECPQEWRASYGDSIRAALEAAAPFIAAQALEEAAEGWWLRDDVQDRFGAWSWLRLRAAELRGQG